MFVKKERCEERAGERRECSTGESVAALHFLGHRFFQPLPCFAAPPNRCHQSPFVGGRDRRWEHPRKQDGNFCPTHRCRARDLLHAVMQPFSFLFFCGQLGFVFGYLPAGGCGIVCPPFGQPVFTSETSGVFSHTKGNGKRGECGCGINEERRRADWRQC